MMRILNKMILTSFLLISGTFLMAQPKKVVADKIIAVVGNKIVLQSDIDNSLQDMTRQGMEIPENAKCITRRHITSLLKFVHCAKTPTC